MVVLLHGIGRDSQTWQNLITELRTEPVRTVAFDLLGFGNSPKPEWIDYSADDHAKAVIRSVERLKPDGPVILVGHSMGCLVAVRMAATRPDLVCHLVLYEMPLYKGLPNKRYYRLRLNLYQRLYDKVMSIDPTANKNGTGLTERLARKYTGLGVSLKSWQPYVKSLKHTIYHQTAPEDLLKVTVPMDVIYGSFDMLVIRGTIRHVYGREDTAPVIHTVRAGHRVTKKASRFLATRIGAILLTEKM